MAKNVLIVTSSLRPGSNSDALAAAFAGGAQAGGNAVETVSLKGRSVGFCVGCLTCQDTGRCVLRDDGSELAGRIGRADVVVFATPVYYYGLSGQLKTLLDRCNPLYDSEYAFREVYLLATAADGEESAMEGPVKALEGWVSCFEKARLAGTVFCGGVDAPGEIEGRAALQTAWEMGRAIR